MYRTNKYRGVIVKEFSDSISFASAKAKGDDWFSGQIIWSDGSVDVCGGGEFLKLSNYPIKLDYQKTVAFLREKRGYKL